MNQPSPSSRHKPGPGGFPFGSELGPDLSQTERTKPARKKKIRVMGALLEDGSRVRHPCRSSLTPREPAYSPVFALKLCYSFEETL